MDKYIKRFSNLNIFRAEDAFLYTKWKSEELIALSALDDQLNDEIATGSFSFTEKRRMKKEGEQRGENISNLCDEFMSLELALAHLVRFSPKLLLEYVFVCMENEGKNSYEFFENVYFGEFESANQTVRQYMAQLTKNPRLLLKRYCNDEYMYYHMILPTSVGEFEDSVSALCFPRRKKVFVLDDNFKLSKEFQDFPYLEPAMRELVTYRFDHPDLTQKEVLIECIQKKREEIGAKTYSF